MKELEQAIQKAFAGMVESGQLTKIIETKVGEAVDSVFNNCFRHHSPFQQALGDHINKNLSVDFDGLGLAGYNDTLLKIIKTKLDASVFKFAEKQISDGLDALLKNPPAEIKLSELVNMLRLEAQEENEYHESVSCHVEVRERGWGTVYLDKKRDVAKGDCKFEIAFSDKGEVYRLGLPYSGDVSKKLFAGPFFGFERALFQMYCAKSKIILDEDHVNLGRH